GPAGLAELAVVDDVDAGLGLPRNNLVHRLLEIRIELCAAGIVRLEQRLRPDDAADMRRQNAIVATFPGTVSWELVSGGRVRLEGDEARARHELARVVIAQRKLEIAARKPRMLAHQRFGAFTLACFDRTHDALMLVLRDREHHMRFR